MAQCRKILDKIDFLIKAQQIAEGVDQVEPLMADLVKAIRSSSSCRVEVEAKFEHLLGLIDINTVEILQYCMFVLRWRSLYLLGESLLKAEASVARKRLYQRFLESFSDSWPELDLYDTLSASDQRAGGTNPSG